MRLKLVLAYDGTTFSGWQIQEKANPPPTVQGAVETALFTLVGEKIRVFGAGRTDAGVHALGQTAHCDVPEKTWDWRLRLNSVLPAEIRVLGVEAVAKDFHARINAVSKTYFYQFWPHSTPLLPQLRNYVWACGALNIAPMQSGLQKFLGSHDFASFQNSGTPLKSTQRDIYAIDLIEVPGLQAWQTPLLQLRITGNGFLKQMVRNIAGYLAAIGLNKQDWQNFRQILESKERRALPTATAPARGLFLEKVEYKA